MHTVFTPCLVFIERSFFFHVIFHWLTTGSSNGILLEQEKEPAISKPFLPFYSATTLQAPTFEHGCDLSRPLSWQQLADIARRANIIDEHDGKPLADKIEQSARQKITTICIDAIDDEPYVSSQINPMLFCRNQIVQSANWLASALGATDRFIAVYKNMSLTDIKIPAFIESVQVRQMSGRYPMETRAFRSLGKQTFIAGAASLLHLHRAITEGKVQTTSFVTVAGNCVTNPRNFEVSIGTPVSSLLERSGLLREPSYILEGGQCTVSASATLTTPSSAPAPAPSSPFAWTVRAAVQLHRLRTLCRGVPIGTQPAQTVPVYHHQPFAKAISLGLHSCIGCSSCSYICPSRLDLAHTIIGAKDRLTGESKQ